MKPPFNLSTGSIVFHREHENGATEAYLLDNECMTNAEWAEYCQATAPKPKSVKRTWAQIKAASNSV